MIYADLKPEYADLWDRASVSDHFSGPSLATAKKIHAAKERYQEIEAKTGVPWWWVGITHAMESGCRFSTHLHNGDPLTQRTRLVPSGRPRTGSPPFSWEFSACDALEMHGLHQVKDWSVTRCLYEWERYNGWGYRKYHPGTLSPYLWSGTPHYRAGKYVADGKWSATAVSGQTGCAALLLRLIEIDNSIAIYHHVAPSEPKVVSEITPDAYASADEKPVPVKTLVAAGGTAGGVVVAKGVENAPAGTWDTTMTMAAKMASFAGSHWQTVAAIGGVTALLWFLPKLTGNKQ